MIATIKSFLSTAMAVIMLALQIIGIVPLSGGPVVYGGEPYAYGDENISDWLVFIEDGKSDYVIIYPDEASDVVVKAVNELQDYIYKISGCKLSKASDAEKIVYENAIYVGETCYEGTVYDVNRNELIADGFYKSVQDDNIILAGFDDRGTRYAVDSFLEEQLGVRWFTEDLTVVPQTKTVKCDLSLDDIQNPYFEYRDVYWIPEYNDEDYKVHMKTNSNVSGETISKENGSGVNYADFCHSMERMVPESYFDEHPEYFSYREEKGEYTLDQRCLTNPDVLAITIESARTTLKRTTGDRIMSITQNDNTRYCQCENCAAMDERLGGPSGTNIWFVNQVARALGDEFPEVAFDTFAYQYTRQAPTVIIEGENTPDDNVIVRLCSIECCFAHPLSECGHEKDESIEDYVSDIESSFAKDLENWSAICERIYIWDYTTNFSFYLMPFPNLQVLGPNLQFFAENNVKGVFEQGNYTSVKSGEFGELRAYLLGKLVWDPWADVEYHMMDFMNAYYGEASAPYIKQYIDDITKKTVETSHLFIFNWHYQNTFMRTWNTIPLDKMWDKAEENSGSDEQLDNIRRSRLSLRFYKATMLVGEFGILHPITRRQANEQLYNDILDLGVTRVNEWKPIYELSWRDFWATPTSWRDPLELPWYDELPPAVT